MTPVNTNVELTEKARTLYPMRTLTYADTPYTLSFIPGLPFNLAEFKNYNNFIQIGFGMYIGFARGGFDDYCAYVIWQDPVTKEWSYAMAKDSFYFSLLLVLDTYFDRTTLWNDIVMLFRYAGRPGQVAQYLPCYNGIFWARPDLVAWLRQRAKCYKNTFYDGEMLYLNTMMHIYMGMIAENCKANARVGSLIKLLGVFDVLVRRWPIDFSCERNCGSFPGNESVRLAARISAECAELGLRFDM